MAGTISEILDTRGPIGVLILTAIADAADGSYPEIVAKARLSGTLLSLETNPGSPAPTINYDIVLEDAEGHDVLEGVGANRSATNTEKDIIVFSGTEMHPAVAKSDVLTLKITGSTVNSAVIAIKLYFRGSAEA